MLRFFEVLRKVVMLDVILVAVNGVAGYVLAVFGYSIVEAIGDMMLVEVAGLLILAGLLDFGSSIGMFQFRKVFFASKENYSASKRKDSERKALVFLFAALILFSILILAAVYELA